MTVGAPGRAGGSAGSSWPVASSDCLDLLASLSASLPRSCSQGLCPHCYPTDLATPLWKTHLFPSPCLLDSVCLRPGPAPGQMFMRAWGHTVGQTPSWQFQAQQCPCLVGPHRSPTGSVGQSLLERGRRLGWAQGGLRRHLSLSQGPGCSGFCSCLRRCTLFAAPAVAGGFCLPLPTGAHVPHWHLSPPESASSGHPPPEWLLHSIGYDSGW